MVEGESGIMAISPPWDKPIYEPSKRRLTWPSTGAIATTYSAEEPDRLRGPQHDAGWCDEAAAWPYLETWDNFLFGLRLGRDPRAVVTTTPKPVKLIRDILADPLTVVTRGSTYDNRGNLAPAFVHAILKRYEGTRLGRQELWAELLEDIPGALWQRAYFERTRVSLAQVPPLVRIVIGVDPSVTSTADSAETGIVVAGAAENGHVYILFDGSGRMSPGDWGKLVVYLFRKFQADRVIGETNNGGDLVENNLRAPGLGGGGWSLAYRGVRAKRNKQTRAEPASALYEQGRVHHVTLPMAQKLDGSWAFVNMPDMPVIEGFRPQTLEQLEDQCCSWVPGQGMDSPDRMDALVWAIYDLVIDPSEESTVVTSGDWRVRISPV